MRRLVLGIAVAVTSLIPVLGMADDQQIADFIKSRLQAEQSQGNLKGFNVDMRVENGTVWFKGHVSNPAQEMTILTSAQQAGHLGVVKVVDDIEVKAIAAPAQQPAVFQQAAITAPVPMQAQRQIVATPVSNPISAVVIEGEPLPFATAGGAGMPAGHAANVGTPTEAPEPSRLCLAWICSSPELRCCDLSATVQCISMAIHRPILPIPPSSTWMA